MKNKPINIKKLGINLKLNYFLIPCLYALVFVVHYLPHKYGDLQFGKDGGGIFRILAILIITSMYFFILKKFKFIWLILGFLNGFFTFVFAIILAYFYKWIGFPDFSTSLVVDDLIIMTIFIITGNIIMSKKW